MELQGLLLKDLCHQKLRFQKGQWDDLSYIKKYHSKETCVDFKRFNTKRFCQAVVSLKRKSSIIYKSLNDKRLYLIHSQY